MITILEDEPLGIPTFAQVTVKFNQDENNICVDYLKRPCEVYSCDVCDYSVNPDTIVGYDEGEAKLTVTIKGSVVPSPRDFSTMIRDFYRSTGFMWTSRFEQDVLSEVYRAQEV